MPPVARMAAGLHRPLGASELEGKDVRLAFACVNTPVRLRFAETGLIDELGADRFYPTVRAAVAARSSASSA